MDGEKFDDLLKRLCTTRLTRLDALRGLVAGATAAVTGATLGSDETEAKKKGSCKRGGVKAQGKKNKKGGKGNGKPTNPGGNITCPGGLKVDSGQFRPGKCGNVKHSTNGCECWIRWCVSADGKRLSFGPVEGEVSCLVGRVVVKGGPASEVYEFNPPVTSADGLVSPKLDNGNLPEISHFTFCDIECPPCDPDDCPEKPCKEAYCNDQGKCAYRPIVCHDGDPCTIDTCNPKTGQCEHEPVDCDDGDLCTTDRCNPKTGECEYSDIVCPPRTGCDGVCNPKSGECEYTCICLAEESPKGCPNPGDTPRYTCKHCEGNTQGSLQVGCNGTTPKCVCRSNTCTINGQSFNSGTDVTSVCPPVQCDTGLPV